MRSTGEDVLGSRSFAPQERIDDHKGLFPGHVRKERVQREGLVSKQEDAFEKHVILIILHDLR